MGVDYIARKSAKKRKKKERQAVGKDGVAQRERRRKKIRRLCQGVCYKAPELTEEDKRWSDGEEPETAAYDSDVEEAAARAASHQFASTSTADDAKKPQSKSTSDKDKPAKKRKLDSDKPGGKDGKPTMSTSVQLLDPAVLAQNARQAALRKLPAGAKADALERFPALLQACMLSQHHVEPTPIQERCWPPALEGRDMQGIAEPGSGKTLAYLLPGLVKLQAEGHTAASQPEGPAMLVLLPTRELAQQVAAQCRHNRAVTGLRTVCVFGGSPREEQAALLAEKHPHVLVATPGRLLDLVDGGELKLQGHVKYLVLDEADKMLSLGFKPQLDRLYDMLLKPYGDGLAAAAVEPSSKDAKKSKKQKKGQAKGQAEPPPATESAAANDGGDGQQQQGSAVGGRPQVLLFSATMPADVTAATAQWLRRPEKVHVSASGANAISRTITQVVHVCAEHKKPDKLLKHLSRIRDSTPAGSRNPPRVLVFANRVKTVRFLANTLAKDGLGYKVVQLHGQRSQAERNQAVSDFRSGKAQVLVATDVAARGLDIRALPYVVNYDFPSRLETYVHRVGRTGRLAAYGHAYSFFTRNLAPLAPPLLELLQAHDQAVDPNLAALATAWRLAEEKLGGAGAVAAAARMKEPPAAASAEGGDDGAGGGEEAEGDEDDDEGDASAAAAEALGGEGLSLAEEILGAAEDLMEGLGPRDARAIATLLQKKLSKQQQPQQQQQPGKQKRQNPDRGGAEGDEDGSAPPAADGSQQLGKKQRREAAAATEGGAAAAPRKVLRPGDAQLVPTTKGQRQAMSKQQQQAAGEPGGGEVRSAPFVASKKFTSVMAGYVFKRGSLGLGYYLDDPPLAAAAAAAKKAGAAKPSAAGIAKAVPPTGATAVAGAKADGKGGKPIAAAGKPKAAAAAAAGTTAATKTKATAAAAAAWGLPTRNKPIIPVRHSDFLSDSDEDGGGGRGASSDPDDDSYDGGLEPEDLDMAEAGKRRGGHPAKGGSGGAAQGHHQRQQQQTEGGQKRSGGSANDFDGGDSDGDEEEEENDDSEGLPEGGLRAVAKKKHKALPGRLRKKLAKMKGSGGSPGQQAQQGKGQGKKSSPGGGKPAGAGGRQRPGGRPQQGGKQKAAGR